MMDKSPLLSICIPTYNRSCILSDNLIVLLNLPSFDDEVELVVSDNNSTDNTEDVVKAFMHKYPNKNIVYHKNETNIKDKNFLKALSLGKGRYLKLMNDYTIINNTDLTFIKKCIANDHTEASQWFFYDRLRVKGNGRELPIVTIKDMDGFVKLVNNKITWIPNFGCWKRQISCLSQFEDQSELQLLQMLWSLHLISETNDVKVVGMKYNTIPRNKDYRLSYNFFQVHVANYYKILKMYYHKGCLTSSAIRFDKKRVLQDFIGKSIIIYLFGGKCRGKDYFTSWKIVIKHFWNIPFFYIMPFTMPFVWVWRKCSNNAERI